ncbi:MAG: isoaspartyl peptidase/L-asparaginase [Planctomycetota bacterium]|jgi:N4-(beta-N-acetylglucosaminyl)-L-asparaginase
MLTRRQLLAAGAAATLLGRARAAPARNPVAVSSANGLRTVRKACESIAAGARPVAAAVDGVTLVENDPHDMSVGYGGLPNEEGVVELDSCVMDGTRGMGGAVAGIRDIKNPSQVALKVMDRTDHVLLVGHGAYRFARAHGFEHTELLTEAARKKWLAWKEKLSDTDDWMAEKEGGTISCLARAPDGRMGGTTTTSGLPFKLPGRVGDSPVIGAGLYVDDTAGAAGATGRGEACILTCASFLAVEAMRRGATAAEAALEACRRIRDRTRIERLRDEQGRPRFDVKIYCLRKDGTHGAASIWSGGKYAVQDADGARVLPARHLYAR